ncbi:tetratricopeptide repeat protein [Ferruginibacter sp.]|uniref:tetratricopeptide repeat protein n=1 Tax=Ferruginibacter sp. TaxID=1940288 RepID=UPI0019C65AFC|nr:tetratricopeptide repeat protein [Ferruginibacter sp.]MBC7626999.1 hypothetical protein [Ferruginibacter sp.]
MVKHFTFLLLVCCSIAATAQSVKIDSLKNLLVKPQADSNRVTLLWKLAEQYQFFKPDTTIELAQQAQLLSKHIKYIEGESRSFAVMATGQYLLGNYTASLNNYMQKLKIEEKRKSVRNYASALNNIGLIYILLSDYEKALNYLYRAHSTVIAAGGAVKKELENGILTNLGETFYKLKNIDSAKHYFSAALKTGIKNESSFYQGVAFLGLGNVLAAEGNDSVAMMNYRNAVPFLNDGTNNDMLCETALGFANIFQRTTQPDSALRYARLAFDIARHDGFLSRELDAANFLSSFFKRQKKLDSAFVYMEQAVMLQDSLKGQSKTREAMIISTNEQIRQAEIAEQELREKETRLQQLQILAICIFIPIFFILTVAFSRIRIYKNVVRFMGVVSLLLFFEFLILLLHPLIEELMHHNKILELLMLVLIGAGLVPLHHKLEHIVLEKLTKEKNLKIEKSENLNENNCIGEQKNKEPETKDLLSTSVIEEVGNDLKKSSSVDNTTEDDSNNVNT